MRYEFVDQILNICKTNAVVTLRKMKISKFYLYILEKYTILIITKRLYQLKLQKVKENYKLALESYKCYNRLT